MKKVLFVGLLVLSLILLAACVPTQPTGGGNHTQGPENVSSVVSIYDSEMNLVGTFSYSSATDNTIDVAQFAKTGYKIDGIFDMNRDVMLFNASGKQVPTIMLDMDFTAIVKYSPVTYQLVFDAGEGELENAAEYTQMISYEEAVGLFPKAVQQGKELDGWFDENGNRFSNGPTPVFPKFTEEGYTLPGEVITLYARYTTKYCDVRLMMQDGTNDIRLQVEYGQKLPDLSQYLKDDGSRVIMGFGVSPNASEPFEDAVYTDLDLYALWVDYKNVNLVYTSTDIKVIKIFRDGNMCSLPDGERVGYVFEGWYGTSLLSGSKITSVPFHSLADTYYAKWSIANYTIQFVADGKLISSSTFNIENTDILVPAVPVKAHYSGKWEEYTLEFEDMIVNAVYEPEQIQVTLMSGTDFTYHTVSYGEMYKLPVPVRKGYTFVGWYYNNEKLTEGDGKSLRPYTFDSTVTLTAKWTPIICVLNFETNGGDTIAPVNVEYGKPYDLTQVPTRNGYYFAGWFDETMAQEYVSTITVTKDTVIYAKWVKSTAIYDAEDLKKIADNPAGNYHLVANINLKGKDWTPIPEFSGILDGNGYKIYNFNLRQNGADLGFVITNSGTIKNVTFSNVELVSIAEGRINYAFGVVCAYNTGKLVNINLNNTSVLVSIASINANNTIEVGCMVGANSNLIVSCNVQSQLTVNADMRTVADDGTSTTYLHIGGIVGRNSGTISNVESECTVDVKENVIAVNSHSYASWNKSRKNAYVRIGGISGAEYGTLTSGTAKFSCILYSTADGWCDTDYDDGYPSRYTYIGGVTGACFEGSSIADCCSMGQIELSRVGVQADYYEFMVGGIIGQVGGAVNNVASTVDITVKKGFGGFTGGIAGKITNGGKASNVAYYGMIKTESFNGGCFAGLAGWVEGMLTKGYACGNIISESKNQADIVGRIGTSGAVSRTISNGNVQAVYVTREGSATNNYVIGVDYGVEMLTDWELLFMKLCLFDADVWSIDEETGLYLIAFPENTLGGEE